MQVRTLVPLPSLCLSNLRICYLDPFKPLQERRGFLQENYYFHCDCSRCLQEEQEQEQELEQEEGVRRARQQGEAFLHSNLDIKEAEQVVRGVVEVLGEEDLLSLRATKLLFNVHLEQGRVDEAVVWGRLCCASYRYHVHRNPAAFAQTLLKLANALRVQVSFFSTTHAAACTPG